MLYHPYVTVLDLGILRSSCEEDQSDWTLERRDLKISFENCLSLSFFSLCPTLEVFLSSKVGLFWEPCGRSNLISNRAKLSDFYNVRRCCLKNIM